MLELYGEKNHIHTTYEGAHHWVAEVTLHDERTQVGTSAIRTDIQVSPRLVKINTVHAIIRNNKSFWHNHATAARINNQLIEQKTSRIQLPKLLQL